MEKQDFRHSDGPRRESTDFLIDRSEGSENRSKTLVSGTSKSKSVLRMRYEADVSVIKKRLGSLEEMRAKLGLTQRKMSQLLLVDPSAWTRWTKGREDAPPHIYRMLQWYLALEDKYPALDPQFWLAATARIREPEEAAKLTSATLEIETQHRMLLTELVDLREEMRRRERAATRKLWLFSGLAFLTSFILSLLVLGR